MEWEYPDEKTSETEVYTHTIWKANGETGNKVTWVGMMKTGLEEEI